MKLINKKLGNVAIKIPNILFPKNTIDLNKWAVIACDQYTSDEQYWNNVSKKIGFSPSTYKLMLPEVHLESPNKNKMLKKISSEMKKYLRNKTLLPLGDGFMYIERVTSYGNIRKGIIICIDLDMYDYKKDSTSLIRPTENTILNRIPPRVKIRESAVIELPHVMLLIDDPNKTVIEPLSSMKNSYNKLYDFNLMLNGGHIEGYHINSIQDMEHLSKSLHDLANKENFNRKYNTDKELLLFAVGDGNHSLASAKSHWENIKSTLDIKEIDSHPARYALVEIINIRDESLNFEPIHRVLFNTNLNDFIEFLKLDEIEIHKYTDIEQLKQKVYEKAFSKNEHSFGLICDKKYLFVTIKNTTSSLACGTIQTLVDKFIGEKETQIDYIHDIEGLLNISTDKSIGFLMPPIDKSNFFKTIIEEGTMPRKTFSMGHADEKRFYLETRKIKL